VTREEAIEIARECAKGKPQSYYAEPFQPHEWVIDAIIMGHAIARAEEKPHRGPPYLTPKPAVCGMTLPMNYVEFPQFADHITCPVCLIILASERRKALPKNTQLEPQQVLADSRAECSQSAAWVVQIRNGLEIARFNPRHIEAIVWSVPDGGA